MDNYHELEIQDSETLEFVDFTQYLTERGMTVQEMDKEAGLETMDGVTHRGKYAEKWKINAVCHALNGTQTQTVFRLLRPEYITVRYLNPEHGRTTSSMFVRERPAAFRKRTSDGVLWDGMTFTLTER